MNLIFFYLEFFLDFYIHCVMDIKIHGLLLSVVTVGKPY